jgi:ABC transporter
VRPSLPAMALLEAKAFHGGRSAYQHLLCLALANGIGRARVGAVLELVGLGRVARKRAGYSLGMSQRLGIAVALLGDPPVLMLDEPVNGLDPDGVVWIRTPLKSLAVEGRTVFLSSHLMSEMSLTADRLIIIGRGRLIAQASIGEFLAAGSSSSVRASSSQVGQLAALLEARGATVTRPGRRHHRIAACFVTYLIFQAFLPSGDSMRTSLSDPGVLRAVTGAACTWRCSGPWAGSRASGGLLTTPLTPTRAPDVPTHVEWSDTQGTIGFA